MTYSLEIRPDAVADIEEAARWYEAREPGLGSDFADAVLQAMGRLRGQGDPSRALTKA